MFGGLNLHNGSSNSASSSAPPKSPVAASSFSFISQEVEAEEEVAPAAAPQNVSPEDILTSATAASSDSGSALPGAADPVPQLIISSARTQPQKRQIKKVKRSRKVGYDKGPPVDHHQQAPPTGAGVNGGAGEDGGERSSTKSVDSDAGFDGSNDDKAKEEASRGREEVERKIAEANYFLEQQEKQRQQELDDRETGHKSQQAEPDDKKPSVEGRRQPQEGDSKGVVGGGVVGGGGGSWIGRIFSRQSSASEALSKQARQANHAKQVENKVESRDAAGKYDGGGGKGDSVVATSSSSSISSFNPSENSSGASKDERGGAENENERDPQVPTSPPSPPSSISPKPELSSSQEVDADADADVDSSEEPQAVTTRSPTPPSEPTPFGAYTSSVDKMRAFATSCRASCRSLSASLSEKSALVRSMMSSISSLGDEISDLESAQLSAANVEDYENAHSIGLSIAEVKEKEQALRKELQNTREDLQRILEEIEQTRRSMGSALDDLSSSLTSVSSSMSDYLSGDCTTQSSSYVECKKRIEGEFKRLEIDERHILRDEKNIKEEREELDSTIGEQTVEAEGMKAKAEGRLSEVTEEISRLELLLKEKRDERDSIKCTLNMHNDSISEVRGKFERQLGRLNKRQAEVQEARLEWDKEKAKFDIEMSDILSSIKEHDDLLESHSKLEMEISGEIQTVEGLKEELVKEEEGREVIRGATKSRDEKLKETKDLELTLSRDLSQAEDALAESAKDIGRVGEEIGKIDLNLPILESRKKAAAAKRDFRAAGEASKDIKVESERRCDFVKSKEALESGRVEWEKKMDAASRDLQDCREEIGKIQKKNAQKEIEALGERVSGLRKRRLNAVPGAMSEVRSIVLSCQEDLYLGLIGKLCVDWDLTWDDGGLEGDGDVQEGAEQEQEKGEAEAEASVEVEEVEEKEKEEEEEGKAQEDEKEDGEEVIKDIIEGVIEEVDGDGPGDGPGDVNGHSVSEEDEQERRKELEGKIEELEEAITSAVENDDYDEAARLDEEIQKLKAAIE